VKTASTYVRFDATLAFDGQTDGRAEMLYTALRRAEKRKMNV